MRSTAGPSSSVVPHRPSATDASTPLEPQPAPRRRRKKAPVSEPPFREVAFAPPMIGPEEVAEVVDSLTSSWITTGPKTKAFESAFGSYLGSPAEDAIMVSSCTDAMLIALAVHGIGPGDEVLVPTLTFSSTAHVVEHQGAKPVFVDVLSDTLCIDPMAAAEAITPATKAIMPVHYAGHPAPLLAIEELADTQGLHVVEDAAHALPTSYQGRSVGSRDNFAAFSFYATKNLTTAEGGALTGSPALLEAARPYALHGMSRDAWKRYGKGGSWSYDVIVAGFKSNMTDLQAAIGLQQLKKLDGFQERRKQVVRKYDGAFDGHPALQMPTVWPEAESALHLYVLRLRPEALTITRDAFIDALGALGVQASVHFLPVHQTHYYKTKYGDQQGRFPVAEEAFRRMVSLPLHPGLSDDDVDHVIESVMHLVTSHAA